MTETDPDTSDLDTVLCELEHELDMTDSERVRETGRGLAHLMD
jgi:hypothetical protein